MDPRSNCASGSAAGQVGSNMQGMGRPSKGLIAFLACGHARTSRISSLSIARTAATLKKVEPRVGTRNLHCEKRWFSTSASKAGSSTLAYVLHGFWWHYGSLVRPDLDKYPEDIFRSLCEPWLDPYEYNEHIHTSMFKECRHGIGHGVFYPLAARQDPSLVSVRKVRMEGTLPVSDATYCEGLRICDGAPDEKGQMAVYGANSRHGRRVANAKACCYGGLRHSIKLYSPRMPTDWECLGETDPAIQAAIRDNVPIKLSRGTA